VDHFELETVRPKKIHRIPPVRSAIRKLRRAVQYLRAQLLHQLVDLVDLLTFLDVEGEVMKSHFVDFERMADELRLCFPDVDRDAAQPGKTLTVSRCPLRS
jgi:hypothetical protein